MWVFVWGFYLAEAIWMMERAPCPLRGQDLPSPRCRVTARLCLAKALAWACHSGPKSLLYL